MAKPKSHHINAKIFNGQEASERKRILWISHLLPFPPKGGVLQRSFNLIRELSKYNEVFVVGFYQQALLEIHYDSLNEGLKTGIDALKEFCTVIDFFPIDSDRSSVSKAFLAFTSLFSLRGYSVRWLISRQLAECLKNLTRKHQFDIVHFDTISLAEYDFLFPNTALSLDHHNIESHMMLRRAKKESNIFKKAYFLQEGWKLLKYEQKHCRPPMLNLTCSSLDMARLRSSLPNALVSVIPNGVDLNYFHSKSVFKTIDKNDFTILFAGRLNAYANSRAARDLLFKIWPVVNSSFPGAKCIIAGSNPPADVVGEARKHRNIFVTGFVNDIRDIFRNADIFVCPITDGGGTKLKVLDALATQIPLIVDPIACEGLAIENGKHALFATTPEEYLEQISNVLDNPELAKNMVLQGRHLIENEYSYQIIGKMLDRELKAIL